MGVPQSHRFTRLVDIETLPIVDALTMLIQCPMICPQVFFLLADTLSFT
jgi:hypothetical protein